MTAEFTLCDGSPACININQLNYFSPLMTERWSSSLTGGSWHYREAKLIPLNTKRAARQ